MTALEDSIPATQAIMIADVLLGMEQQLAGINHSLTQGLAEIKAAMDVQASTHAQLVGLIDCSSQWFSWELNRQLNFVRGIIGRGNPIFDHVFRRSQELIKAARETAAFLPPHARERLLTKAGDLEKMLAEAPREESREPVPLYPEQRQ